MPQRDVAWPWSAAPKGTAPCPGTLTVTRYTNPDALPAYEPGQTGNYDYAASVAEGERLNVEKHYQHVVSVTVGPGAGYVWDRTPIGAVIVRHVKTYGLFIRLRSRTDCPRPDQFPYGLRYVVSGLDTTFVAPTR